MDVGDDVLESNPRQKGWQNFAAAPSKAPGWISWKNLPRNIPSTGGIHLLGSLENGADSFLPLVPVECFPECGNALSSLQLSFPSSLTNEQPEITKKFFRNISFEVAKSQQS